MFSQNAQPHSSKSSMPFESNLRFGMTLAQFLHEWFETMAQMVDLTRRACELFVENGGASTGQAGPSGLKTPRNASEQVNGSVDMEKLKQSLQSMDPMQAAQVMHAVQVMQAMETMQRGQRSRANEPHGAAW